MALERGHRWPPMAGSLDGGSAALDSGSAALDSGSAALDSAKAATYALAYRLTSNRSPIGNQTTATPAKALRAQLAPRFG